MHVSCQSYDLRLRDPFTISRGTVTVQPTLIVRLEHEGLVGLGEATTNDYYGVTLQSMSTALQRVAPQLANHQLENPAELWRELDPLLQDCRFAQCALDCAVWDLYAQQHGQPLWQLWGLRADDGYPPSCFTIGLDTPEQMVRKTDQYGRKAGWTYGAVDGTSRGLRRLGYGFYELFTFTCPTYRGTFKPPYERCGQDNRIEMNVHDGLSEFPPELGFETYFDHTRTQKF